MELLLLKGWSSAPRRVSGDWKSSCSLGMYRALQAALDSVPSVVAFFPVTVVIVCWF